METEIKVLIWEKIEGKHRTRDDKMKFQADIVGFGFDHHGVGETPAQAMFNAALHWRSTEERDNI